MRRHVQGRYRGRHLLRPATELVRRYGLVQETGVHGTRRIIDPGQPHRLIEMRRRQPGAGELHAEPGQRHADGHFVQAELEVALHSDAVVGRQAEQRPHRHRVSAHREYHGALELQQPAGELGALSQQLEGVAAAFSHDRQVEARTESPGPAGNDHDLAAVGRRVEAGVQTLQHSEGQCVGLPIVHGEQEVIVVFGDFQDFGHGALPGDDAPV